MNEVQTITMPQMGQEMIFEQVPDVYIEENFFLSSGVFNKIESVYCFRLIEERIQN